MAQNFTNEFQGFGGGFPGFGGFGGFGGGIGPVGLFGLLGCDHHDHGRRDCDKDHRAEIAALLMQGGEIRRDVSESASNIRRDVVDAASELRGDISDARHEVTESESRLRETVHASDLARAQEIRGVLDRICDGEKETLKIAHLLSREGLQNTLDVKNQVREFEARTAENFCTLRGEVKDVKQAILDRLSADKLDEKNDIIEQLRAERAQLQQNIAFSNQLSLINSQLIDLSHNQRIAQGQQTIQFGAGNHAGQKSTNNQVG